MHPAFFFFWNGVQSPKNVFLCYLSWLETDQRRHKFNKHALILHVWDLFDLFETVQLNQQIVELTVSKQSSQVPFLKLFSLSEWTFLDPTTHHSAPVVPLSSLQVTNRNALCVWAALLVYITLFVLVPQSWISTCVCVCKQTALVSLSLYEWIIKSSTNVELKVCES